MLKSRIDMVKLLSSRTDVLQQAKTTILNGHGDQRGIERPVFNREPMIEVIIGPHGGQGRL